MKTLDDQSIVNYLQSGDPEQQEAALRFVYRQYYGLVESLVVTNSGKKEDVPDLFQEVVIVLFNQIKQPDFTLRYTLKAFIYAIAKNLWLMNLRRQKHQPLQLDESIANIMLDESYFKTLESNEKKELIKSLILQLGEECQRIIHLFYYRKMRMAQIKEVMTLASEQVAKNKKSKCLGRLRKNVLESAYYQEALR